MPSSIPPVTRALLLANVAGFGLQFLLGPSLIINFALWPPASGRFPGMPSFEIWQLVTHSFLHAGFTHLFFNMFALYMFGGPIEQAFGARRFATYYIVCVAGAAIAQLAYKSTVDGLPGYSLGASGGVFGVLLAFGMLFPREKLVIFPLPIPIQAWLFVTLYGLLELYLGVTGTTDGIGHFAHLGGMVTGFVLLMRWRRQRRPG